MKDISTTGVCPRDDIAAYLDGELSVDAAGTLEEHTAECSICRRSLSEQRQLLAALGASLAQDADLDLPEDFTKKIVVNAESTVAGLRRPGEVMTASLICAALFFFAVFALGSDTVNIAAAFAGTGEKLVAIGAFIIKLFANIAFACVVILRALGSHAAGLPLVMTTVAALLVFLFSSFWILKRRGARV